MGREPLAGEMRSSCSAVGAGISEPLLGVPDQNAQMERGNAAFTWGGGQC